MLSFNTKRDTKVNRPASGNAGKENVKYVDFTTTVQLPEETTLSDEAQAALEAGTAIRGSGAYTAGGTKFAYRYDAYSVQLLSIEYDAAARTVTARYRQGWYSDSEPLSGNPQFRLQVILENPQRIGTYTAKAETKETVYYDFSEPQDIGTPQSANVDFSVGDPHLKVYYKVVEGLNDIYSGRSGVAGNSYTFQVFAENQYPRDYTKMGMLRDEIGWSRYLTPESLAAVFGTPQASGYTPGAHDHQCDTVQNSCARKRKDVRREKAEDDLDPIYQWGRGRKIQCAHQQYRPDADNEQCHNHHADCKQPTAD